MEKIWELYPAIKLKNELKHPEQSWITAQLLFNRGLTRQEDIDVFFNNDNIEAVHDPFLFKDMTVAVELVVSHIKAGNLITVYGDYDADGVTAAALLSETLSVLKAKTDTYLPERVSEGYGLNREALKLIAEAGAKLVITVDTGIRNKEEVAYAQELGLETIVTDHHVPPDKKNELPRGAIIDPLMPGEAYPDKKLAGAGVAYKFACALIKRSTMTDKQKAQLSERLLDLAAIGTVADCVPLIGENREIVKRGLAVLNRTKRVGLLELVKSAQLRNANALDAWNISFQIAPRLNAAGRLDHANTAYELLVTKDAAEAAAIAEKLNGRNQERQRITELTAAEVEAQVDETEKIIIGVYDKNNGTDIWNEGVIGLVAGRLCEKYYRPTLVITRSGDDYKGSARSIEGFNIIEAVSECKELLSRYGGHAGACGFSLLPENLADFKEKITKIARQKLDQADLRPRILIEAELRLEEINDKLIKEISQFAPFGQGNERPRFLSRNVRIVDIQNMGNEGQHIKLRLKSEYSQVLSAIGFGQTEKWQELEIGQAIDIVYYAELNSYNGRTEAQLKIIDIKRSER